MPAVPQCINDIDRHVAHRVEMRRRFLGFTRARVADAIGRSVQYVIKCEKAEQRIYVADLTKFAGVLSVPVSYFFEDLVLPEPSPMSAETVDLVSAYFRAPPSFRGPFLEVLIKTAAVFDPPE